MYYTNASWVSSYRSEKLVIVWWLTGGPYVTINYFSSDANVNNIVQMLVPGDNNEIKPPWNTKFYDLLNCGVCKNIQLHKLGVALPIAYATTTWRVQSPILRTWSRQVIFVRRRQQRLRSLSRPGSFPYRRCFSRVSWLTSWVPVDAPV